MKTYINAALTAGLLFAVSFQACKKESNRPFNSGSVYLQTNLVSDTAAFGTTIIDANLVNAWGLAFGQTGAAWISSNGKGLSVIYDQNGNTLLPPVTIPAQGAAGTGSPTGVVSNTTSFFVIPQNQQVSRFIFSSEDGIISAWSPGITTAFQVADRSGFNTVYKGLATGSVGANSFLYAANFKGGSIDVFDQNFNMVTTMPFSDPAIPADFGPFNIQNIGNQLYVTYAKRLAPDNKDDQRGQGNGYVNIFNLDGTFVKRFASQGTLNSPWGIAQAPAGFGEGANAILIGNFGDGHINVFDANGNFKEQLKDDKNQVLVIDGLWALVFSPTNVNQLFFTAGPKEETHGLFGFLMKK
ncbi:MAG TPA: TIGR03118 family protein [Daejeonella sp.]|nr:TIGR03118 family protein [Daejeonella sp.]